MSSVSLTAQIAALEQGLTNLQKRVETFPVTEILISRLLISLGREISNHLDHRLRPFGLGEAEFKVLMSIYGAADNAVNPGDLCVGMSQSPANITRLTDSLVERGLISRIPDEHDRRKLLLQLTPQGVTLIKKLMPVTVEGAQKIYREFSRTELKKILSDLKKLAALVDREIESGINRKSGND